MISIQINIVGKHKLDDGGRLVFSEDHKRAMSEELTRSCLSNEVVDLLDKPFCVSSFEKQIDKNSIKETYVIAESK